MRNRISYNYRRFGKSVELPTFVKLSDVEKVLTLLENDIKQNGHVTAAKFYEFTGGYVLEDDEKYGWTNLDGCRIEKTRYGYLLSMPGSQELNIDPIKEAYDILCNNADDCDGAVDEAIALLSKAL